MRILCPQRCAANSHHHFASRVAFVFNRLASDSTGDGLKWEGVFQKVELGKSAGYQQLVASSVDLPTKAATCNPVELVLPSLADSIMDVNAMFPLGSQTELGHQDATDEEYIKLVVREVQCGKLNLRLHAKSVGDVFGFGRKDSGRQRKVWDGPEISKAAARAP